MQTTIENYHIQNMPVSAYSVASSTESQLPQSSLPQLPMPASLYSISSSIESRLSQSSLSPLPRLLSNFEDEKDLREQIRHIDGNNATRLAILSFRSLQLHRIAKLQAQLAEKQNALMNPLDTNQFLPSQEKTRNEIENENEEKEIDSLLQRYGTFN